MDYEFFSCFRNNFLKFVSVYKADEKTTSTITAKYQILWARAAAVPKYTVSMLHTADRRLQVMDYLSPVMTVEGCLNALEESLQAEWEVLR